MQVRSQRARMAEPKLVVGDKDARGLYRQYFEIRDSIARFESDYRKPGLASAERLAISRSLEMLRELRRNVADMVNEYFEARGVSERLV